MPLTKPLPQGVIVGTTDTQTLSSKTLTAPIISSITNTGTLTLPTTTGTVALTSSSITGSAASFTGSLIGDVTGTQGATVVSKVNGVAITGTAAAGKSLQATSATAAAWGNSLILDVTMAPYNADSTGTADSATAINSAITAAGAAGGGIVFLPKGNYKVNSVIALNVSGVTIAGVAGPLTDANGPTRIFAGASIAQIISVTGTNLSGVGLLDLQLDASSNVTGSALQVLGVQYSNFTNLRILGPPAAYCIVIEALVSRNTMHNKWQTIYIQPGTTNGSVGMLISGNFTNNTSNTCYEDFDDVVIAWSAAATGVTITGLWLQACDNIRFHGLHYYGVAPVGTNLAIKFDYSSTGGGAWPCDTYIDAADFGGTGVTFQNVGTLVGATVNRIIGISGTNGRPANPNLPNLVWEEPAAGAQTALADATITSLPTTPGDPGSGGTGPNVTVNIGPSGMAMVSTYCNFNVVAGGYVGMFFVVSGANTLAAADNYGIFALSAAGRYGATFLLTGLAAGVTTFSSKYNSGSTTSAITGRRITVVPL